MKWVNRKQTKIITGNTAFEFQEELNKALADIAGKGYKHELQFNMSYGLCAYIVYDEYYEVAETISDEYELRGERHHCYECPMYLPSEDKRVKYTTCGNGVKRCAASDYACDWLYEQIEKGGIRLNGEKTSPAES